MHTRWIFLSWMGNSQLDDDDCPKGLWLRWWNNSTEFAFLFSIVVTRSFHFPLSSIKITKQQGTFFTVWCFSSKKLIGIQTVKLLTKQPTFLFQKLWIQKIILFNTRAEKFFVPAQKWVLKIKIYSISAIINTNIIISRSLHISHRHLGHQVRLIHRDNSV